MDVNSLLFFFPSLIALLTLLPDCCCTNSFSAFILFSSYEVWRSHIEISVGWVHQLSIFIKSQAQREGRKSWREPNTLGPHVLQSWRGCVPWDSDPWEMGHCPFVFHDIGL